jgi:hypothetical protein
MIVHDSSWEVEATREEIWAVFHPPGTAKRSETSVTRPRVMEFRNVRIEVLHEGDRDGNGLVRRTWYAVPWYVGGKSRSWELVSQVKRPEFQRYDAITTPPAAYAMGWIRLTEVGERRTRVHFHEEYTMQNRFLAWFLERPVHRFISRDNDKNVKGLIEDGLRALRATAHESAVAV